MGRVSLFDLQGWITLFIGGLLALITFFSSYSHVSIPFAGTAQINQQIGVLLLAALVPALLGDVELATRRRLRADRDRARAENEAARERNRAARRAQFQNRCALVQLNVWSRRPLAAHRRLAILDLSPAAHQPMFSSTGRYGLDAAQKRQQRRQLGLAIPRQLYLVSDPHHFPRAHWAAQIASGGHGVAVLPLPVLQGDLAVQGDLVEQGLSSNSSLRSSPDWPSWRDALRLQLWRATGSTAAGLLPHQRRLKQIACGEAG